MFKRLRRTNCTQICKKIIIRLSRYNKTLCIIPKRIGLKKKINQVHIYLYAQCIPMALSLSLYIMCYISLPRIRRWAKRCTLCAREYSTRASPARLQSIKTTTIPTATTTKKLRATDSPRRRPIAPPATSYFSIIFLSKIYHILWVSQLVCRGQITMNDETRVDLGPVHDFG